MLGDVFGAALGTCWPPQGQLGNQPWINHPGGFANQQQQGYFMDYRFGIQNALAQGQQVFLPREFGNRGSSSDRRMPKPRPAGRWFRFRKRARRFGWFLWRWADYPLPWAF